MTIPDEKQIQNCTVMKEASHFSFDKFSGNESNSSIFIHSCKVIRRDDTSLVNQTFPSAFDVLSRDSARLQDHQNPDCLKMLSNRTYINDSWDLCSFLEDLEKSAMSLEKGISSRRDNVVLGDEPKRSDVDMEKVTSEVKSTMAGDHYNASADLFEASNNPGDNGTSLLQHIGQNNGQGRLLFSIINSPCTDLLPYRPRDSRISVSSVSEIYETWNNLPTEDFAPYLQSTPLLRRLPGTSRLAVDAQCLRMTSNSRSSIVSIRTKSSSTIKHIFLKNTRQRKSAMFHGLSENWSPNLSPFLSSERSTVMIAKNRRTMLSHKLWKKEAILENEKDYETLRHGPTVKGTDCGTILGKDSIKHGGDVPDNVENLSPVNCSLQEGKDRLCSLQEQQLPSDWSPELFPGKSNRSQPHECLQRRLF
ncbi:DNA damage-induced apoptosis suppressor protein isoform X1 [Bufo gargarizans]|uniref:DNA damage-induced apoptosis suppressor protein isoform X1 n=1 Tax=Bufo gargarizans TaxID=30331 RepID=UPI001CF200F2|nr:DNA damage-induced apoptosis suppressor protein isoform X1 [Bufo gargarizans]